MTTTTIHEAASPTEPGLVRLYLIASPEGVDALIDALDALDALSGAGYNVPSPADYPNMAAMCTGLVDSDAVVMIDGWETCPGAHVEISLATALGKPVLSLSDLLPLAA